MMPYQPYQSTWQNPFLPQYNQGQPVQPMVQPYQQPVNGIVKVNGRDSAMQYQLPPNSTSPALFDNNGKVFYVISTDGTGTKSIEVFDFLPHVDEQPIQIDGAQFVSRQEFEDFTAKVNAAIGAINGSNAAVPATAVPAAGTADGAKSAHVAAPLDATGGHVGAGV